MNITEQNLAFAITLGAGCRRPQGLRRVLRGASLVAALANVLADSKRQQEAWWSPHVWENDYRQERGWQALFALAADLDFHGADGKHVAVTSEMRSRFNASRDLFPASLHHPTPRGERFVLVLDSAVTDPAQAKSLGITYGRRLQRILGVVGLAAQPRQVGEGRGKKKVHVDGLRVDTSVSSDLARFLYTPNAVVNGVVRSANVTVVRDTPFAVATVLAWANEDIGEGVGT